MKPTLFILAAGMGSRYGGLKQLDGVGPSGETIMDYSVFDAIRAGFGKIVFVIRHDFEEDFKEKVLSKYKNHIQVELCFQDLHALPAGFKCPEGRTKPWGTNHAVLMGQDIINEPFAVINADDFYGQDAYQKAADYLKDIKDDNYGIVAYRLGNTLTPNGSAKRGVCEVTENNELIKLTESKVQLDGEEVDVEPLDGSEGFKTSKNTIASMNFLLFNETLLPMLDEKMLTFLEENKDNLESCEFLIPVVLNECVEENTKVVDVIETTATWYGITYKEDKEMVTKALEQMVEDKVYTKKLWS